MEFLKMNCQRDASTLRTEGNCWLQYKSFMLTGQFQTKSLQEIIYFLPNFVTGFRFLLNFVAVLLFPQLPQTAGLILMFSIILDYFDGAVARKYNQCTFFGETFDWVTDMTSYAIVLLWWNQLEPQFILLFFTLFCLEIIVMITDIISKCHGYAPKLSTNKWSTFILKYTMNCQSRGYVPKGVGFYSEFFHFLCIVSRILYVRCENELWLYVFVSMVPLSVTYVWMHYGYTVNILERWNEQFYGKQQTQVKFIEQ